MGADYNLIWDLDYVTFTHTVLLEGCMKYMYVCVKHLFIYFYIYFFINLLFFLLFITVTVFC